MNFDDDDRAARTARGELELLPRASGFSGAISLPLLPDLIQIYTVSMADGALTIRRASESGTIWFSHGAMVHATCGALIGEEAVYALLTWDDGSFAHDSTSTAPTQSITASWQEVLMEGCRRLDEAAMAGTAAPALELAAPATEPYSALFSTIEQSLDGFLGVAVLDANGSLVAQRSRDRALDFATAGPFVAELLRQQASVMRSLGRAASLLDSLAILGDQVHLIETLPDGQLLYLAVTRDAVNLAVLRRVVDRALGRLA
ncbi:MAG TPA: DUF4388 domain-containing protein [Thermoanaerobaculia bacterium]|nr:DUF4388 domain-containing protein [Thermoanaerobaculia bacterium]